MDENLNYDELLKQAFSEETSTDETSTTDESGASSEQEETDVQETVQNDVSGDVVSRDDVSSDKNRQFAAARREAEGKYNALSQEVDDYFRAQGFKSFADAKEAQRKEALEKEIGNLGFNGKDIAPSVEAIVNNMPAMQAARALAEQAEQEKQELAFNREFEKIQKLDPSIKTVEDLLGMENRALFDDYVLKSNIPLAEAYKLVHFDRLMNEKAEAASKKTFNNVAGKQHLTRTSTAGGETVKVPDDVYAMYRALNPDASDEEIRKHYAKSLK